MMMLDDATLTLVDFAADVAAILTAAASVTIAVVLAFRGLGEMWRLEAYLRRMTRDEQKNGSQGLKRVLEVTRQTKLGEEAIMRAAFRSRRIRIRSHTDDDGRTRELLIGYGRHDRD
jgi:hypothetical protein